jgi:hypothetical protein
MNRFVSVSVKCAVCTKQFGEANHRFVLHDDTRGQTVTVASGASANASLYTVRKFRPDDMLQPHDYPVCGENCLHSLEGQLLSGKVL